MNFRPRVTVFHDNCREGCRHCFCKPSRLADRAETEQLLASLSDLGYETEVYVADQRDEDALARFAAHGGIPRYREMKDVIPPALLQEDADPATPIGLSLHGHTAELHELLCPPGNFGKTVAALEQARDRGLTGIRVYCVISRANLRHVEEIGAFLASFGVRDLVFVRLGRGGRATALPADLFLEAADIRDFSGRFIAARRKLAGRITLRLETQAWGPLCSSFRIGLLGMLGRVLRTRRRVCDCGNASVVIDAATNKVFPCYAMIGLAGADMGTYDERDGFAVTPDPLGGDDLGERIGEPCRSCSLFWCCGGHCRVRAFERIVAAGGAPDPLAGHPLCPVALGIRTPLDRHELKQTVKDLLYLAAPPLYRLLFRAVRGRRQESHAVLASYT